MVSISIYVSSNEPNIRIRNKKEVWTNRVYAQLGTQDNELFRGKGICKKAFFAIERSGPIYRGDNQKILHELMPMIRKQFMAKRHELSKLAMENHLEKDDIIQTFTEIFYQ